MNHSAYTEMMAEFKYNLSDENQKVAAILKMISIQYDLGLILDVGSGLGDIATAAIPEHMVIHLDTEDYSKFPVPLSHKRVRGDFLEFTTTQQINTLFMCHVMQYIDEDMQAIQNKVDELGADYILLTLNKNNDFLGKLADWSLKNITHANPELSYTGFPSGYEQLEAIDYIGSVSADSWDMLLKNIMCVLMDVDYDGLSSKEKSGLLEFAQEHLTVPSFTINQTFFVYKKLIGK